MSRVHTDLGSRPGARSVVMAHAFVAGSADAAVDMASDSERDISVGGVQIAPTRLFTRVDYAALGHLHGRQTLSDTIRYSGSPLAYSFSEARHTKGSWLVELGRHGVERTDFVPAPVPRRLATLRGRIDDLHLTKYRETVDPESPTITLFSPAGVPNAYFVEQGWVSAGGAVKLAADHLRIGQAET